MSVISRLLVSPKVSYLFMKIKMSAFTTTADKSRRKNENI